MLVLLALLLSCPSHSLQVRRHGGTRTSRMHMSGAHADMFASAVSVNSDLQEAAKEVAASMKTLAAVDKYVSAVVFVSSAYEGAACQYEDILESLLAHMPSIVTAIGCTTGATVGMSGGLPVETENKASLSVLLIKESHVQLSVQRFEQSQVEEMVSHAATSTGSETRGVRLMLSTDAVKPYLTSFMNRLSADTGVSDMFGGFASGVSSYHKPKVFMYAKGQTDRLERFTDGAVALSLLGDVRVDLFVARSCVPVGPMFEIGVRKGKEIMGLKRYDGTGTSDAEPPLVQLESVLAEVTPMERYGLTRELLLATVAHSPASISQASIAQQPDFFSQKPTSFDPYTGSLSVSALPEQGGSFQFCVRDGKASRREVTDTQAQIAALVSAPLATPVLGLLVGSMDRGNKLFRFQSWESLQMFHSLRDSGFGEAPVSGFFSNGAFARLPLSEGRYSSSIMEADSLYAVISTGSNRPQESSATHSNIALEGVMSEFELRHFSDETEGAAVEKGQGETSNAVRVAGMDYLVPDKLPQARYVLEQLVWERQKDVDRLRERMSMARALGQAKLAADRFPRRNLGQAVSTAAKTTTLAPVIVELHRSSISNGKLVFDPSHMAEQMKKLALAAVIPGVVAIGAQTDISFSGLYEDLESIKKSSELPVLCNDFVVFGYQLFRAKASGADAVKLIASVLNYQELTYLIKTAKAIGLDTIVVVASKQQLLGVLKEVKGMTMISLTNRNHFLWKIDRSKVERLLSDVSVQNALAEWRSLAPTNLLFEEGFATKEDMLKAKLHGIDAVILGEEVLSSCAEGADELAYGSALREWLKDYAA